MHCSANLMMKFLLISTPIIGKQPLLNASTHHTYLINEYFVFRAGKVGNELHFYKITIEIDIRFNGNTCLLFELFKSPTCSLTDNSAVIRLNWNLHLTKIWNLNSYSNTFVESDQKIASTLDNYQRQTEISTAVCWLPLVSYRGFSTH